MHLIEEIEISYFRSFYKFKIRHLKDLNIIFGKNDSGKSNLVRALNLFFSGQPEHAQPFEFPIDFSEQRLVESDTSEDVRKFLYVKVTFNTPPSYQRSLGKRFYVKRQWTVSRGQNYHEEMSSNITSSRRHIATRFLNKIKFIYIPAIKDVRIFEMLLAGIHETVAGSDPFLEAVGDFSNRLQELTREMFETLPKEVSTSTKIGAPTQLSQLFKTLDFETVADGETHPKSLTRQRGDGIKVRHIPELLNFISENDRYDFHIWGFEEPENSLDFASAQSEAKRLLALAKGERVQVFMTTHSPSFYLLEDEGAEKFYVRKDANGASGVIQGRELNNFDVQSAIGEGFYLPAVAEAVRNLASVEARAKTSEAMVSTLQAELEAITTPVVLTEGRTDANILLTAWDKRRGGQPPFAIRSCETGGENAGAGNGGAQSLAIRLKGVAADHPHPVIGLFDYDSEGLKAFKLDRNFVDISINGQDAKRGMHGQSYAACLPAPDFRAECKEHQNLPIEFMFQDEHLNAEVNGSKLTLKRMKASRMVGEKKVEQFLPDVTHFKEIGSGKSGFADVVVPTLGAEAFEAFDAVFSMIEAMIAHNQSAD
ncbi:AAA family ATPase [Nitratireductor aquimarinus]|uniref:ATP-dependent nuclease n=1 Tax=Nitratireductor TaxID=245876 RepID=UPI0019D3584C|nr:MULTISPECIES: AAA family ATPase [Nitratireductor]MBN7774740.1 AAA family ATPase [Nitratireductor pacificus]MBN7779601.1 AAA family ATPase [Nitratireductor pacificus]MBN7788408.1 AAA family ATPase [Nitratireductor aquimarinus]MBY6097127.1 AAA family ATPase [Nitratireductor aquimarinus]MCA1262005.1 AAA family ATPase [Nitratireductor aquimarinus]